MTIIAIDPGKSGGIAHYYTSEHITPDAVATQPMPKTTMDLAKALEPAQAFDAIVYVEKVQGFAGKNRPGFHMFGLGESFGLIQGILSAYKARTVLVRPQKWQKRYSLGTRSACQSDNEWKNKLKAEAQRRFPNLHVTLATADALLLLDYALQEERNPQ